MKLSRNKQVGFRFSVCAVLLAAVILNLVVVASAQTKKNNSRSVTDELARLREEFVKSSNEYKAGLEKLLVIYESDARKAQARFDQSKELFEAGLISKNALVESEHAVNAAQIKVLEARLQMTNADAQIANMLVEAQVETQLARTRIARGNLVKNTSYIRYDSGTAWSLSEAWKIQRFFRASFQTILPIAVLGQGPIHDRWRLDHRNAMDISLHPDSAEGQSLMSFLRANGIPFLAFRTAIPGTSTGPHIHIGRPSHRF